jgi:hypothetical protein
MHHCALTTFALCISFFGASKSRHVEEPDRRQTHSSNQIPAVVACNASRLACAMTLQQTAAPPTGRVALLLIRARMLLRSRFWNEDKLLPPFWQVCL